MNEENLGSYSMRREARGSAGVGGLGYDPRPAPPQRVAGPSESEASALSERPSNSEPEATRAPWLLFIGAAIGLALAILGILDLHVGAAALPPDAAARVGEHTILRADYERVLAGVENDRRNPIDAATRRRVLDRMIDEELLVQHALDLGLAEVDRRVRGELTSGLIDSIVGEANAEVASDEEVARHYKENIDFFTRPGRLRAETIFFSPRRDDAHENVSAADRAALALRELRAGADPQEVGTRLGDGQVSALPNALLPKAKIRDYVGPGVLQVLEKIDVGSWSDPIETGGGVRLAHLLEREAPIVPSLKEVEPLVRQDLKRRRADELLRRYLDDLRDERAVVIDESLFESTPDAP